MSERSCEFCGATLSKRRRDARFCNESCRSSAWKRSRQTRPETFRRRKSRDGRGVRVYLTPEDFDSKGDLRVYDLTVARKLDRAFERLLTRGGIS